VRLEIKPVADKTVSIRADIKAKSRLIESSVASVSGQAFRTRGINKIFNVRNGSNVVLMWMVQQAEKAGVKFTYMDEKFKQVTIPVVHDQRNNGVERTSLSVPRRSDR
jgi:hypothetical protein